LRLLDSMAMISPFLTKRRVVDLCRLGSCACPTL